ncbi:MAG: zinc ribbon domain-containing protein [Haloferacaceae archaeon]
MSKITFRADDDLVRELEEFDASKSEVMREALRTFLASERDDDAPDAPPTDSVDDALAQRIDDLIAERLDEQLADRPTAVSRQPPQDVNVTVSLDGVRQESGTADVEPESPTESRKTPAANDPDAAESTRKTCEQCGAELTGEHVYCPNCGEKATHRVFCDCGDELRSDWAFCPGCGRRTPAADVLDRP